MDLYRLIAFAHVLFAIVLVGLALFWFVMLVALRRRFDAAETDRLLGAVNGARWPHVVVPYSLRLPLPWVNWVILVVLVGSGAALLSLRPLPQSAAWWIKLALLAVVVIFQMLVTARPRASLIRINLLLVLGVLAASGLLLR